MQKKRIKALRVASVFMMVLGVIHPVLHYLTMTPLNSAEAGLFHHMRLYHRPMMGGKMSMMDVVDGLNLCYGLFFLLLGALNLTLFKSSPGGNIPASLCRIQGVFFFLLAFVSVILFYWLPVVYASILGACFLWLGTAPENKLKENAAEVKH